MANGQPGNLIKSVEGNGIDELQKELQRIKALLPADCHDVNDNNQITLQPLIDAVDDLTSKHCELQFASNKAVKANPVNAILLTNMSNQIATPINGIRNLIERLSQSDLAATRQHYATIILKSICDLTNFIADIPGLSRMTPDDQLTINDHFDLYEMIQQLRDLFLIPSLVKNIDLILIIYSDTPHLVCGDRFRLKQLLLNLIGHAIECTNTGEVVIKVMVDQQKESVVTILISIEDTGSGLSEKNQGALLDSFRQIDAETDFNLTGTELGLVIAKYLARLLLGELSLESKVNRGSQLLVSLPLLLTSSPTDLDPVTHDDAKTAMIISSRKACLQEITSLFDGAQIATESVLLTTSDNALDINSTIQQNLQLIDFLVVDFRHLHLDLNELLKNISGLAPRIIIMHYDETMIEHPIDFEFEFMATTTHSQQLKLLLDQPLSNPATDSTVTSISSNPIESKTILLVDHNQINLRQLSDLIQSWGHQVYEADNAIQAVELYNHQIFDLIVIELKMPLINGLVLLKMMRREKPLDQTLSIALTDHIRGDEQQTCLMSGFNYCLEKPVNENQLRSIVDGAANDYGSGSIDGPDLKPAEWMSQLCFDLTQSLALCQGNQATLRKIIEILIRDIPDIGQQLKTTVVDNDQKKLSAILHKIQGITCYVSLPRLKQQVSALQQSRLSNSHQQQQDSVLNMLDELNSIQHETALWLNDQGTAEKP